MVSVCSVGHNWIPSGDAGGADLCQRCCRLPDSPDSLIPISPVYQKLIHMCGGGSCCKHWPDLLPPPRTIFIGLPRLWIGRMLPPRQHTDNFLSLSRHRALALYFKFLSLRKLGHGMVSHTPDTASECFHTHTHTPSNTTSIHSHASLYPLKSWF